MVAVGPRGLAHNPDRDILYVASTADNEVFGVGDAARSFYAIAEVRENTRKTPSQ